MKKVVVELSDEVYEALQALPKRKDEEAADVLARAILAAKFLEDQKGKLLVEDKDGSISEVRLS